VALAEAGFLNGIGARVELKSDDLPAEYILFGEDASRVLVSCDRQLLSRIKEVAGKHGVAAEVIGETSAGNLEIVVDGQTVVSAPVSQLKSAWEGALAKALHTETEEHLVPEVLQKS
jgi:phosphoribosylformylglycinamidine (FGAM) synthase-like enzyme